MVDQLTPVELDSQRPGIRDVWEVGRAPGLLAIVTAAITWVIWYYTNTLCTAELTASIGCNPAIIARYIDIDIFGRMLTYSAITAAAGGVWNYNMFTKMRAVIAAETKRADEAEQRLVEYRQRVEEERQELMEELAEARRLADERAAEERRLADERAAEERRLAAEERQQAAEDRRAFLSALSELTAEIAYLRQQRNGNGQSGQ